MVDNYNNVESEVGFPAEEIIGVDQVPPSRLLYPYHWTIYYPHNTREIVMLMWYKN